MSRLSLSALLLLSFVCLSFLISSPFARADDDSSDSIDVDDVDVTDDEGGDIEIDTEYETDFSAETDATTAETQYQFMSHPDVSTSVYFPSYPTKQFEIGEEIVALIGFANTGSKTFNLTYTGANLLSPEDGSYYIQNFSIREVAQIVEPGHELTFEYRFKPDPQLEAAEYRVAAWILYNATDGGMFLNTYFNQTVEIQEKNKGIFGDLGRLVTIFLLLVGVSAVGYFVVTAATGGNKKKRKVKHTGEPKPIAEWETTAYKPAEKQKVFGAKKRSNKKEATGGEKGAKKQEQEE